MQVDSQTAHRQTGPNEDLHQKQSPSTIFQPKNNWEEGDPVELHVCRQVPGVQATLYSRQKKGQNLTIQSLKLLETHNPPNINQVLEVGNVDPPVVVALLCHGNIPLPKWAIKEGRQENGEKHPYGQLRRQAKVSQRDEHHRAEALIAPPGVLQRHVGGEQPTEEEEGVHGEDAPVQRLGRHLGEPLADDERLPEGVEGVPVDGVAHDDPDEGEDAHAVDAGEVVLCGGRVN